MKLIHSNLPFIMKLHSLITALALGMAAQIQAQEKSSTPASPKPVPAVPDPFTGGVAPRTKSVPNVSAGGNTKANDLNIVTQIGGGSNNQSQPFFSGAVVLTANKLRDNFAEIERHLDQLEVPFGAAKPVMPNMIFSQDASDAAMSGSLRIQGVSPVQALALACAAAGCSMEPIFAPAEGTASPAQVQPIIGYRIVRDQPQKYVLRTASNPSAFPEPVVGEKIKADMAVAAAKLSQLRTNFAANHPSVIAGEKELVKFQRALEQSTVESKLPVSGIGVVLEKKDGGVVVTEILPGSPVSAYPEIKRGQRILGVAEDGKPPVDTTSATIEFLVKLLRGEPGTPVDVTFGTDSDKGPKKHTVKLVRTGLPIPDPNVLSGVPIVKALNNTIDLVPTAPEKERKIVRVYATGNVFSGSDEEYIKKLKQHQDSILETLNQARLLQPNPELTDKSLG